MKKPQRVNLSQSLAKDNPLGFQDMEVLYTNKVCEVQGNIPDWLRGNYLKQTGAAFQVQVDQNIALFDGLAGIAAFHFCNQHEVTFSNTILDSAQSRMFVATRGRVRDWFVTMRSTDKQDARVTWLERINMWLYRAFHPTKSVYTGPNPNVVVWRLCDGRVGAATEGDGTILEFSPTDLTSVGPIKTMTPKSMREMVITTPAHYYEQEPFHIALEMKSTGFLPPSFEFTYGIYKGNEVPFQRVGEVPICSFPYTKRSNQPTDKRPAYMHSYAQTPRYLILFLSRERLNYERLLGRDFSKGFFGLFDATELPLQVLVLDKQNGLSEVGRFDDQQTSCHIWHQSNAYEETDGRLVIDCSAADSIHGSLNSYFLRIEINLPQAAMRVERLLPGWSLEFPQVNPLVNFHKYRFAYLLNHAVTTHGCLVKVDLHTKQVVAKACVPENKNLLLAEPVFVPRIRKYGALSSKEEEDGVVLLAVTNVDSGKSFLAVLDARNLQEMGRVIAPITINAGLHSHFFPTEQLLCKI